MTTQVPYILIDGELTSQLQATDRGLHYGDGLFETMLIRDGVPQLWSAHMARLAEGARRLLIPMPEETLLRAEAAQLCASQPQGVLKILLTRGSGGRGYRVPDELLPSRILLCYPWPLFPDFSQGVALRWCETPLSSNPILAGLKHLNRLEQVLARNEWQDKAIYEGLMCDIDGRVIEGTMSNLFVLKDGAILTPELSHCGVAGVMRERFMAMLAASGVSCRQATIRREDVNSADELMISNSLIGLVPVSALAGQPYPIEQGLAYRQTLQQYLESC